jgi:hypothetical protein
MLSRLKPRKLSCTPRSYRANNQEAKDLLQKKTSGLLFNDSYENVFDSRVKLCGARGPPFLWSPPRD